ncbi:MAG: transketolase C-terminal domain-containing protein [Acidobacteriota bacterium]|nr:MAG: transketolase C-terminal domain-containing protein [Acidobacteriota bacterium]
MRAAFAQTLSELAERDERILLMTGDLGFMALEPFSDRFPDRFFNVGVAEQNMIGLATGLAESGYLPFVYSIATFASLRGYEFIRNGPIAHRLPVRIIGVGGGFEYGSAGPTHHGLEDIGVMRLQPGLTVLAPADHRQARNALLATWERDGPIYYRIGKDDRTEVPGLDGRFELGRNELVRDGGKLILVSMGSMAAATVAAAEELDAAALVVSTLNPSPVEDLAGQLSRFERVLTVEAHYVSGGLGSLVAEVIAERGLSCMLERCGVREASDGRSGSPDYYLARHDLSKEAIVARASAPP